VPRYAFASPEVHIYSPYLTLLEVCVDSCCNPPHILETTDINECEPPNQPFYPCKGKCRNTEGSYTCSCPSGLRSDDPKIIPCDQADPNKALKMVIGNWIV
jgi:hypothetical protein